MSHKVTEVKRLYTSFAFCVIYFYTLGGWYTETAEFSAPLCCPKAYRTSPRTKKCAPTNNIRTKAESAASSSRPSPSFIAAHRCQQPQCPHGSGGPRTLSSLPSCKIYCRSIHLVAATHPPKTSRKARVPSHRTCSGSGSGSHTYRHSGRLYPL